MAKSPLEHPGHRFAPLYEPIPEKREVPEIHYGIMCDGPFCKHTSSAYISGIRYKCAVCHDVDFCAGCEAHPSNTHNRTHPLIMFKTPVRNVTVSTVSDGGLHGMPVIMGDNVLQQQQQQQETRAEASSNTEKISTGAEACTTGAEACTTGAEACTTGTCTSPKKAETAAAVFISDSIADGTVFPPNQVFSQTWTLLNPGPSVWPAGSIVRYVGGDSMLNVDANQPSSLDTIVSAMESTQLQAPVEPGQKADFTVQLKTPNREGVAISYWRLKLPDGTAVGDRLWCDVEVQAAAAAYLEEEKENEEKMTEEKVTVDNDDDDEKKKPEEKKFVDDDKPEKGMIFPLLEKESPETSIHEEDGNKNKTLVTTESYKDNNDDDLFEEVENLTLADDGDGEETEDDEGFLTDEEYDILDASDHELVQE